MTHEGDAERTSRCPMAVDKVRRVYLGSGYWKLVCKKIRYVLPSRSGETAVRPTAEPIGQLLIVSIPSRSKLLLERATLSCSCEGRRGTPVRIDVWRGECSIFQSIFERLIVAMEQTITQPPDLDGEARYEIILKRDAPNCVITHKTRKLVVCAQMPIRLKESSFGVLISRKIHTRHLSFHVSLLLDSEKRDGNRFGMQKEIATCC